MSRARDIADTGDNNLDDIVVDGSGNVGIGTSSPATTLHISGNSNNTAALSDTVTDFALKFDSATTTNYFSNAICFAEGTNVNASIASFDGGSGGVQGLVFGTGASNTEAMRIDSSGNVLVGRTSTINGGTNTTSGTQIGSNGLIQAAVSGDTAISLQRLTSDGDIIQFRKDTTAVGSISVTGSATAYNTSSDYRLKENVVADWDATTRLKQLNPVRFNFIADPDTTVDGFLAHEVQDVVPEAISGTKDAMRDEEYEVTPAVLDEDGNVVTPAVMGTRSVPDYQGIDQSKLVPLLVKTIQELEARIAALENA